MNQADKQEIRTNLLFAFAPALAEAIAQNHWKAVEIAKAYQAAIDVLVPTRSTTPFVEDTQPEHDDNDKLCCDLCDKELTYKTANHFSGFLNGKRNIHIHLCDEHSDGLPLIDVGVKTVDTHTKPRN